MTGDIILHYHTCGTKKFFSRRNAKSVTNPTVAKELHSVFRTSKGKQRIGKSAASRRTYRNVVNLNDVARKLNTACTSVNVKKPAFDLVSKNERVVIKGNHAIRSRNGSRRLPKIRDHVEDPSLPDAKLHDYFHRKYNLINREPPEISKRFRREKKEDMLSYVRRKRLQRIEREYDSKVLRDRRLISPETRKRFFKDIFDSEEISETPLEKRNAKLTQTMNDFQVSRDSSYTIMTDNKQFVVYKIEPKSPDVKKQPMICSHLKDAGNSPWFLSPKLFHSQRL